MNTEPTTPSSVEEVLRDLERLLEIHAPYLEAKYFGGAGENTDLLPDPRLFLQTKISVTAAIYLSNDVEDGRAIMLLLDLLESLGWGWNLCAWESGPIAYRLSANNLKTGEELRGLGATRGEAVARAVLAVLSQQEREGQL